MLYWAWLILLLVLLTLILLDNRHKPVTERFTTKPRDINVACLYAAHNLDEYDVAFILKYSKDIPFFIVNNGNLSTEGDKLKGKRNIHITERPNKGYDAGAWKFGMNHYDLSPYSLIIFMNNSCIIGADLKRLCEHAIDYDLYSYGFSYELYRKPYDNPHLHAYMFFVNKRLYNSPQFKEFWNLTDENTCDHECSVQNVEYRLKPYFECHHFKVGAYTFLDVEDTYKYELNDAFCPEILKKREARSYPDKINAHSTGISRNRDRNYIN